MKASSDSFALRWVKLSPRLFPFADAASTELPLARLVRLSLFQISVAMAVVLLNGTLNRVMIVELGVPSSVVATMVSLPLLIAPLRAFIGFRSDNHRSAIGWRRAPYIWIGSLLQFGGLAIMPFALILLSGDTHGPAWVGITGAAISFLLVGIGLHTTQTAGLALATDLAAPDKRPRVVAFLYVMLLAGSITSSAAFAGLLENFSQLRLIQVIQGAAMVTIALNVVALWKQEPRRPTSGFTAADEVHFSTAWRQFIALPRARRTLVALGLGTAAFSMQDILLEPYGGEVLHLTVGKTTSLTGWLSAGTLLGFLVAANLLARNCNTYRLGACGLLVGLLAFPCVILASPLGSVALFQTGATLIGLGSGLFSVSLLTATMTLSAPNKAGVALGAWGAVQATAAGLSIAAGGAIKDLIATSGSTGQLGVAFLDPVASYTAVYHIEIVILFAALAALGPLTSRHSAPLAARHEPFGLAEFPG